MVDTYTVTKASGEKVTRTVKTLDSGRKVITERDSAGNERQIRISGGSGGTRTRTTYKSDSPEKIAESEAAFEKSKKTVEEGYYYDFGQGKRIPISSSEKNFSEETDLRTRNVVQASMLRKDYSLNANTSTLSGESVYTAPPEKISPKTPDVRTGRAVLDRNTGTYRLATAQEEKELAGSGEKPSALRRFGTGFKEAALVGWSNNQIAEENALRLRSQRGTSSAEAFGANLGAFANIYTYTGLPSGLRATSAATTAATKGAVAAIEGSRVARAARSVPVVNQLIRGYSLTQKTWAGRTLVSGASALAQAEAAYQGTRLIGRATENEQQRLIRQSAGYSDAYKVAFQAQDEAVRSRGIWQSIANELPVVGNYLDRNTFRNTFTQRYMEAGYSPAQAEAAANLALRERNFASGGEAAGLLAVSRASESIGRREIAFAFEKAEQKGTQILRNQAFGQIFKRTAPRIAVAGFIEGATSEIIQEQARQRKFSPKDVALMGGLGAGTAGLIGGTIAGARAAQKNAVARFIEVGTYISDPFEKPGDILQDVTEGVTRRLTGRAPRVPVITGAITSNDVLGLGVNTNTPTKSNRGSVVPVLTNINIPTLTPTPTPMPAWTPTPINIPSFANTPTPTPVPVPTPTNTNLPTFAQTNTNVPVNTNVPINVPINIPVSTPVLRLPPPVPLDFGFNTSGYGRGSGKRKTFLNELEASQKLFNELTVGGFGLFGATQQKGTKKSKKRRKR